MSLLATKQDFEEGGLYENYRRYPFFATRAEAIVEEWPDADMLIVGCGWGFLVDELRTRGVEAWGIDMSQYALTMARKELPDTLAYIHRGNAKKIGGAYGVVVTEDLLPCASSDEEARLFVEGAREAGEFVLHVATPAKETTDSRLLAKDEEGWRQFAQPDRLMFDNETIT
jgi:hypothetical protein